MLFLLWYLYVTTAILHVKCEEVEEFILAQLSHSVRWVVKFSKKRSLFCLGQLIREWPKIYQGDISMKSQGFMKSPDGI